MRRELRRLSDAKLDIEQLREALKAEVLKPEVLEGDKAESARRRVSKAAGKSFRIRRENGADSTDDTASDVEAGDVE